MKNENISSSFPLV